MCGIAGLWRTSADAPFALAAEAGAMTDALAHRGPNDRGTWVDPAAGLALGHRRLSVLDLSPHGHQPMACAQGRYVVTFNGELYNWKVLRETLERAGAATRWRGHSDTEVLLAAIAHWGLAETLARAVGMFALALWDRQTRTLSFARDRMGEKPLYYGHSRGALLFGSELKALRAFSRWSGEIDRDVLAEYMRFGYIEAPHSIYADVRQVPPGTVVAFGEEDLRAGAWPTPERYWSFPRAALQPEAIDAPEAIARLDRLLRASIADQMLADVPVGAFLSGGIDSSLVVALMREQGLGRSVRTFSIGFAEQEYDESRYARGVAAHLGTEHTELVVTAAHARDLIPSLATTYDEPLADPSAIPTMLLSRLASRHVTVALSGDGGDELFGGYDRYRWAERVTRARAWLPDAMRVRLARAAGSLSLGMWRALAALARPLAPSALAGPLAADRILKGLALAASGDEDELYRRLAAYWPDARFVLNAQPRDPRAPEQGESIATRMMLRDLRTFLPDDILAKVDRAAMHVSLETRMPLLDHRIVEFAVGLPQSLKLRDGRGKWLLRTLLDRYVPSALVDRPKMGFNAPLDQWLRGPLRDWAAELLDPPRVQAQGLLDPLPVETIWREHLSGRRNWQYRLWNVLMFQSWLEAERDGRAKAAAPEATPRSYAGGLRLVGRP